MKKELIKQEDIETAKHHLKKFPHHKKRKLHHFLKIKYPRLTSFIIAIILAYFLFKNPTITNWISHLESLNYVGIYIAGMLLAIGFSAPFSVGFFLVADPKNLFLAILLGALGGLTSDMLVFKWAKNSFKNEFIKLEKTKTGKEIEKLAHKRIFHKIRKYLLYAFAGIIIASPLPDEIGVTILSGLTTITPRALAILSFILHAIGIAALLLIGVAI